MHAAVDEDGIAGYRTREVARQKHSNIADLLLGHISAEGRRLLGQIAQFADALRRIARQRLSWARRDRVRSDLTGSELRGQVTDLRLESGLRDRHHVVAGDDPVDGVIGHGEDAAAPGGREERGGMAGDGDQRVRADVQGEGVAAAGNLWERAREILAGGKRDAVRDGVQAAPAVLQAGKDGLDLLVVLHIARERGKRGVSAYGVEQGVEVLFQPLALVGERQGGPFTVKRAGDAPGDAALVGDAHDQRLLALEQHTSSSSTCARAGRDLRIYPNASRARSSDLRM